MPDKEEAKSSGAAIILVLFCIKQIECSISLSRFDTTIQFLKYKDTIAFNFRL